MKPQNRFWVTTLLLLNSCVSLQTQHLDTPNVKTSKEIVLFNKDKAKLDQWYTCIQSSNIKLENNILTYSVSEPMGDCFGIFFDPIDVTSHQVIKIKAKYNTSTNIKEIGLLAGFTDTAKNKTYFPEKNIFVSEKSGFIEYTFDYNIECKNKITNFDYTKVNSILFFTNITGIKNTSGNLLIEEITLIKSAK